METRPGTEFPVKKEAYCWSFSQILVRVRTGIQEMSFHLDTAEQPMRGRNTMAILCKGKRVYILFRHKIEFLTAVYLRSCSARPA